MIVGIDLGTTNSLISVWQNQEAKLIPNESGSYLTPSVISIKDNEILVGETALSRLVTYSDLTVANFKRYMGSNKIFKLGNFSFRPEELSAIILKQLKANAEAYLGTEVTEAVISVPAYFNDSQRKATKTAGKLVGLKIERLINEPTAAGIAYGLQEQHDDTNYLIFDLGGGTFDVSILNMFTGVIEVHASNGDNLLGGIDFTKLIENQFMDYLIKNGIKNTDSPKLHQKIYEQANLVKHQLSAEKDVIMKVHWEDRWHEHGISHQGFDKLSVPLLERIKQPIKKVINDSGIPLTKIDQIILVGGASRMFNIRQLVARMFNKLPLCHLNPDTTIALGAAIQASLKAKNKDLQEFVVTDVCPYSLGVAVFNTNVQGRSGLFFDPIIERNTVVPTSRSRTYYPISENQKAVDVEIYQGESIHVENNIFLGKLTINLSKHLSSKAVDIRFSYDINGLLEVDATLVESGENQSLIIKNNATLSEDEVKKKLLNLQSLKIHPREQTENTLILNAAERLYEDLQGDLRHKFATEIKDYLALLDKQDPILIARKRAQLEKIMTEIRQSFNLI